jgi:hypothetical protein
MTPKENPIQIKCYCGHTIFCDCGTLEQPKENNHSVDTNEMITKQTAVEWYFDKIKSHFEHDGDLYEVACMTYAIAKEKEREQIIDAWNGGDYAYFYSKETGKDFEDGEQYYNETYGNYSDTI